ncbi:hypothetical protein KA183_14305 [bacterium]|nr:hypothetical protein [bacterium]
MSDLDLGARDSAESRNGLSVQSALSAADMEYFKPPTTRVDSTAMQVAMGQDQFANYDKQTYVGLQQMENAHVGRFAFTYLNGSERVQSELQSALKSAGVKLESDGTNVKLSLISDEKRSMTLGPSGINVTDNAIGREIVRRVQNRPETRAA